MSDTKYAVGGCLPKMFYVINVNQTDSYGWNNSRHAFFDDFDLAKDLFDYEIKIVKDQINKKNITKGDVKLFQQNKSDHTKINLLKEWKTDE